MEGSGRERRERMGEMKVGWGSNAICSQMMIDGRGSRANAPPK